MKTVSLGIVAIAVLAASGVLADGIVKMGKDAFGTLADDQPGVTRLITIKDLPKPQEAQSANNYTQVVKMPPDAKPILPKGFKAELVASGIAGPRTIRVAPNGDTFVADSKANQVHFYRLKEGSAQIESDGIFADSLHQPYGIAFYPPGLNPEWIYIANSNRVVRYPYKNGDTKATGTPQVIIDHIPETHHWTRDIVFSADGSKLYLAVGSGSNVALDMPPHPNIKGSLEAWKRDQPLGAAWDTERHRANVITYDPDGKNEKIFATGLRNCSGIALQPGTGALWCAVNERDGLGDNTPFDYATEVKQDRFYGWPWYYLGSNEDPRHKGERPDLASSVTVPDVLLQAHSAPLGIAFYNDVAFPVAYQGNAFVALHGSWNRSAKTGYKVVMLLFKNGKPTGEYQDFMTGFALSEKQIWGRPVGIAVAKDGSLLVSDDGNGTIWRVTYTATDTLGQLH